MWLIFLDLFSHVGHRPADYTTILRTPYIQLLRKQLTYLYKFIYNKVNDSINNYK